MPPLNPCSIGRPALQRAGGSKLLARYVYAVAGTYTVPVPAGARVALARARGGGGSGSQLYYDGSSTYQGAGGGGAAAAGSNSIAVAGAASVLLVCGAGGIDGTNNNDGGASTMTVFSKIVLSAEGGKGAIGPVGGRGGLKTNCIGQFAYSGGRGADSYYGNTGNYAADGENNPGSSDPSNYGNGGGAAADLMPFPLIPVGGRGGMIPIGTQGSNGNGIPIGPGAGSAGQVRNYQSIERGADGMIAVEFYS